MKCEYPGKTNVGAGSGTGAGSPTKGRPVIVVPPPKHESLEVRRQEVAVWERANELAEACLEVDRDMVCTMRDLAHAMGCVNVGVLSVVGAGVPGGSVGVGWSGEREEGASKEKGKGEERAVAEDEGEGGEGAGEGLGGSGGLHVGRGYMYGDGEGMDR